MTGRSLKILLIVSLVLNVFLIGGIGGGVYQWLAAGEPQRLVSAQRGLRFAADELGAEHRRAFRATLREARRAARTEIDNGRAGRRDVLRLLAAPTLDRQAVEDALDRTRKADFALRSRIEDGVIDYALTLTPDERRTLAQGLARRGPMQQQGAPRP